MNGRTAHARAITLALLFSVSTAFAQTSLVTDRATLAGTDFFDWGTLGPEVTLVPNPATLNSDGGIGFDMAKSEASSSFTLQQGSFWTGNFAPGEMILWTTDANNNFNPLVFGPFDAGPVCAFGLQIQSVFLAEGDLGFTAMIEGFDGSAVSIGSHTRDGISNQNGDDSAIFIGMTSTEPMHSVAVGVTEDSGMGHIGYYAINQVDFTVCPDGPEPEPLVKTIVDGNDVDLDLEIDRVVEVGITDPALYSFTIAYNGTEPVLIEDTVPAEWDAVAAAPNDLNCLVAGANKKSNSKSATKIDCSASGAGVSQFDAIGRCKNGRHGQCKPTSCGALYLNDGALAYAVDESGVPLTDEFGATLPPVHTSNALCLAAVSDLGGDGIDFTGNGDEDGDTLTDYTEACDLGLDPCNADTDSDGVDDDLDACPLEGLPGEGEYQDETGCNQPDEV